MKIDLETQSTKDMPPVPKKSKKKPDRAERLLVQHDRCKKLENAEFRIRTAVTECDLARDLLSDAKAPERLRQKARSLRAMIRGLADEIRYEALGARALLEEI